MQERIPALVFGGALVLTAVVMLISQRRAWGRMVADPGLSRELPFLKRRTRRRSQIAGMILMIGIMIPVGDSLIPWKEAPGTFAVYWTIVLALALWTGILAVGDLVSTQVQMSSELHRLQRYEHQLRDAAEQLRKRSSSDGDR